MITTYTMTNGKDITNFTTRDKTNIKLENRLSVEIALGKILEDYTNIKLKSVNHYEDNGDLIEKIPFHNKEKDAN